MNVAADYYSLLGVPANASLTEIKQAYRRLARELHPDTNPDPLAEERFKEIARAYAVLSDPERKRHYDRFGADGQATGPGGDSYGFGGGLGDIFDAFFGGQSPFPGSGRGSGQAGAPRGADMEITIDIAFTEAVFGISRPVTLRQPVSCDMCEGSGAAPGTTPETCRDCGGTGQVRRVRQSVLGQMVTASPCAGCGGVGQSVRQPCPACRGEGRRTEERTYTVDIPAGVDHGATLRLSERGAAGPRSGGYGDLYVHLRVKPHDRFNRSGYDLTEELHLPLTQAALGVSLNYETLDGNVTLEIPAGSQAGKVLRVRDVGVPHLEGRARGDILVHLAVDVPTGLSRAEEELLRQLAEERGEVVAPPDSGLISRLRGAFKP